MPDTTRKWQEQHLKQLDEAGARRSGAMPTRLTGRNRLWFSLGCALMGLWAAFTAQTRSCQHQPCPSECRTYCATKYGLLRPPLPVWEVDGARLPDLRKETNR